MRTLAYLLALALVAPLARAQTAPKILLPHQGFLTNAEDVPVDDTVSLTFRLFANPTKPPDSTEAALWTGTYEVRAVKGRYTVLLGATDGGRAPLLPEYFSSTSARYLAVEIATVELAPRLRIGLVPNALKAEEAAHALDSDRLAGQSLTDLDARYARISSGSQGISFGSTVTATAFAGNGAQLTQLDASSVSAGTLDEARLPTTLARGYTFTNAQNRFTGDGAGLEALDASKLTTGTLADGRLSGTYGQALRLTNGANDFTGKFSGNLTGDVTGNVTGNLTGNVTGGITGTGAFTQLKLPVGASAAGVCDASRLGQAYVDTSDGSLRYCNGTAWRALRPRPAQIIASAYSLDFGTVTRTTPITRTVALTNIGDEPLTSLQITPTGTGYTQTNDCGTQIAAGAGCTITVSLTPTGANGARSGTVAVATGSTQLLAFALTGTVSIRSFSLSFDNNVTDQDGRYAFSTSAIANYSSAQKATGTHSIQANVYSGRPADYAVSSAAPDPVWALGSSTGDFDLEFNYRHQQDIGYCGVIASNTLSWANTQGAPLPNTGTASALSDASGWVLAVGWTAQTVHFSTGGGAVSWSGFGGYATTFRRVKFSRRGSTLELFVDGVSLGTRTQPTFTPASTSTLYLVGSTNGNAYSNPSPSLYYWVDDMKFVAY